MRLNDVMPGRHPHLPGFIAPAPHLRAGGDEWCEEIRRIESRGFDVLAVSEHYTEGWALEPLAAVAFAAASTSRMWVAPLVLNNDLRHPAILAKAVCTADVLSGGRIMVGLGAGWLGADYEALGVPFDPAGVRLSRLEESLHILREFFAGPTVSFDGNHYSLRGLEALPVPVRKTGPPILVGAGGPRILRLAGRHADIVGIHVTHTERGFDERAAREMSLPQIKKKIDIVTTAAAEAGRPRPVVQLSPVVVAVNGKASTGHRPVFTDYILSHPEEFAESPAVLLGSPSYVAARIQQWSAELGVGLWHLGRDLDGVSEVIAASQ